MTGRDGLLFAFSRCVAAVVVLSETGVAIRRFTEGIDMAINIGDSIGGGASAGSVLFVGAGTVLAQDNADFYYEPSINTLKTKDQNNANTSNFAIGTGDVTGSSSGNSGTLTIDTGNGSPNISGSSPAGNSGTVTVITGAGGASNNSSAAGVSGNLLLKTGAGGGNAFSGATGGKAGDIIERDIRVDPQRLVEAIGQRGGGHVVARLVDRGISKHAPHCIAALCQPHKRRLARRLDVRRNRYENYTLSRRANC
jgi:hypothetical protein